MYWRICLRTKLYNKPQMREWLISALAPKTIGMSNLIFKEESYQIIGMCMEVHNNLGAGFLEIVYKDALEYEFRKAGIPYEREKQYTVNYKDIILPHKFYADFIVYGKIILEVKAIAGIADEFIAQAINYLKVSENQLALIVNFGELRLNSKRIVLEEKLREWKRNGH